MGDSGRSCGYMQVSTAHFSITKMTCDEMRKSAYMGATAAARVMEHLVKECGSLESAMGAYASGHCGWAQDIVKNRCDLMGGCKDDVVVQSAPAT